jgi:hypothetical protein
MRLSCTISGATQTRKGGRESSLAHSREATRVRVGGELDRQIGRIHGAMIPLKPET